MSTPPAIAYTRFLFISLRQDDDVSLARLRAAGSVVVRGFFNDFEAEGPRDAAPHETIQFLVADTPGSAEDGIRGARYAIQVTAKYRPRLGEVEAELKRRIGDAGTIQSLEGAERAPRYSSAEMHDFAYRRAATRRSGRVAPVAVILPINKTADWWAQPPLNRHAYFYPHTDIVSGTPVPGHAQSAADGVTTLHRRLYHNADGYQRAGEYDFITYFECDASQVDTFERVHRALQDTTKNPEWRFVREGPEWRGRRVLRW
jgi:hypothetical protein